MPIKLKFTILFSFLFLLFLEAFPQTKKIDTTGPLAETFEASTPCTGLVAPWFEMPAEIKCELMKWTLTFYKDALGTPSTYQLRCEYGMSQPNTTGIKGGGTIVNKSGTWKINRGRVKDFNAVVYQLDPDKPGHSISFVKLSNQLLHLLYKDQTLMTGTGGYSYTFNRSGN